MKYVYSNSSYWVEKFEFHLKDLARITQKGGKIVLQVKTDKIMDYKSEKYLPFMGSKFHEIIDAGRMSTYKGLRSKKEIITILKGIDNVSIKRIDPIYGGMLAKIWDIGLRPLFNPLAKMANNLSIDQRVEIKEEWGEIFYKLLSDLLLDYEVQDNEAIEYSIILEKK